MPAPCLSHVFTNKDIPVTQSPELLPSLASYLPVPPTHPPPTHLQRTHRKPHGERATHPPSTHLSSAHPPSTHPPFTHLTTTHPPSTHPQRITAGRTASAPPIRPGLDGKDLQRELDEKAARPGLETRLGLVQAKADTNQVGGASYISYKEKSAYKNQVSHWLCKCKSGQTPTGVSAKSWPEPNSKLHRPCNPGQTPAGVSGLLPCH
eukprot:95678-Chlamydomonas_euryale.AAC.7